MNFQRFLSHLQSSRDYNGQVVRTQELPAREAAFGELSEPLPEVLSRALEGVGIEKLYTHQASAIEHIRAGKSVAIVTSTASGKTLCYNIPVIEKILSEPEAKAIYLFPTKALAQDQLKALRRLADLDPFLASTIKSGTYDGDTPTDTRRKLRDNGNVILTNPDMLHSGIMPYHARWNRFFSNLKYVVIDEIHTYRGIFGSNVADVIRRLRRICRHYGSDPQFICCSATIANPLELAEKLVGVPMELVTNDGSPKGKKLFVMWNPPFIDQAKMERLSSNVEAQRLMVDLMRDRCQTITFCRARIVAELMYKYVRETLQRYSPGLANSIRAYRGGYLPEERREIERQLFSGELLGVTTTNALELGIDVGSLDASIIIGFPGTIASTWQQAGRAGRGAEDSVVFFIGYNDPIDQYLMRHPDYFFDQTPEHAIIDPENAYILANHLRCAAFELPLMAVDSQYFGENTESVAEILAEFGQVKRIADQWFWATKEYPSRTVNLRTMSDNTFTIVDTTRDNRVIGSIDAISAPELVYQQAIYMHEAETYIVENLDFENKVAYVKRADVDYYTQAIVDAGIRIIDKQYERDLSVSSCRPSCFDGAQHGQGRQDESSDLPTVSQDPATRSDTPATLSASKGERGTLVALGEVTVTWATTAFKKIKFYSLDSIGWGKVDIPEQSLETMGMWLVPDSKILAKVREYDRNPVEGLLGIRNVAVHVLPLFAMCDKQDIGGIVDSSNTGTPTIFLFDRYPGGLGYAEKGYDMVEELLESCLNLIHECQCEDGCPSCVGIPILRPAMHMDPDALGGYPIPDKEAALVLLHDLLGKDPYTPKPKPVEEIAPMPEPEPEPPKVELSEPVSATVIADRLRMRLREKKAPNAE